MIEAEGLDGTVDYLKNLWYGDPKQGKTSHMASLAKMGKIIAVDMEGRGWRKQSLLARGIPVENIKVYRPKSHAEVIDTYWEIHGLMFDGDQDIVGVMLDHWTELESRVLQESRRERIAKARRKALSSGTPEGQVIANELNPYASEIQDYGLWTNKAKEVLRLYRDLPCHVGMAAHFRTDKGQRVPDLTEKFRNALMGSMNMIIGTTTTEVQGRLFYIGYMRNVQGWVGGDEFDCTRPCVVNPTFERLVLAAQGKLDFETDPETIEFKALLEG